MCIGMGKMPLERIYQTECIFIASKQKEPMKPLPNSTGWPFLNKQEQSPKIILASASPRRRSLLEQIGVKFEIIPSTIEEDISLSLKPDKFVEYYAQVKAKNVSQKNRDALVIGADTVVVFNKSILGKPGSFDEAYTMLSTLSGNTHSVYTGVSLQLINKSISHTFHAQTQVTFNNLTNKEIEFYIEYYKPYDKAGSYGIQDWFSVCVEKIDGCYFNVMGLPLNKLYTELKSIVQIN